MNKALGRRFTWQIRIAMLCGALQAASGRWLGAAGVGEILRSPRLIGGSARPLIRSHERLRIARYPAETRGRDA